jgi:Glycolipid transfer protein (GLTP)
MTIVTTTAGTTILVSVGMYLRYCANELHPHQTQTGGLLPPTFASGPADICTDFRRLQFHLSNPIMAAVLMVAFLSHLPALWKERIRTTLQHNIKSVRLWRNDGSKLRRSGGSHSRALSALSRVTSVDTFKNLSKNLLTSWDHSHYPLRAALQAITRKECFARSDYIERLSVNDVALLFRYASSDVQTGRDGGEEERRKFLAEQSPVVRAVMTAMDMAVRVSRGRLAPEGGKKASSSASQRRQQTRAPDDGGDMDALYFVAATRIFAEWRTIRVVPRGYQRYAVALSLAYRDVLQNLEKMERGVHDYLKHHQGTTQSNSDDAQTPSSGSLRSPTLRELLQFELHSKVHRNLPYLAERSASSGLLWTKRQLHYQTATFHNMLEVPVYYPTPRDAAQAAYRIVYGDYHGWAIQQIFSHGFGGSPPLETLWATLDPPKDLPENGKDVATRKMSGGKSTGSQNGPTRRWPKTMGGVGQSTPHSFDDPPERTLSDVTDGSLVRSANGSDSSDCNNIKQDGGREEVMDNLFLRAVENVGREVAEKWQDMVRLFNCGGGEEKKKAKSNLILSSESHFDLNQLAMTSGSPTAASEFLHHRHRGRADDDDGATAVTASTQSSSYSGTSCYYDDRDDDGVLATAVGAPPRRQQTNEIMMSPMEQSKRDTEDFVRLVSPMIADLGKLLDEFNMNDPSRV